MLPRIGMVSIAFGHLNLIHTSCAFGFHHGKVTRVFDFPKLKNFRVFVCLFVLFFRKSKVPFNFKSEILVFLVVLVPTRRQSASSRV